MMNRKNNFKSEYLLKTSVVLNLEAFCRGLSTTGFFISGSS